MSSNQRLLAGLLILLLASFFRLWQFEQVPPGLQHDEIFKAQEAVRLVEQGDFRLFYPTNQGHEGGFIWLLSLSYILVGINPLMIRFPAFVCGILIVALLYRFGSRRFSPLAGTVAGGLAAVSFWPVFVSRVGLRAGMLPVVVLIVLIGLAQILEVSEAKSRRRTAALTGIALGFAIYTYTASFALYLAVVVFSVIVFARGFLEGKRIRKDLALIGVIAMVLALPMVHVRLSDPQGLNRATSITKPLQDALDSRPQALIENGIKLIAMPAFVGDPTWRYNVAGRPLFLLPIGLLVYAGFLLSVRRSLRSPIHIMLIALAAFGLIPSLLTVLAPSYLRSIILLPSIFLFIGIAVAACADLFRNRPWVGWSFAALIIAATAIADYRAYFVNWQQSLNPNLAFHREHEQGSSVHEIYRDDLQQLAHFLREREEELVFVSTPDPGLDPLLYNFSAGSSRGPSRIVFFDAFANIVLNDQPSLLLVSPLSPISEKHRPWLTKDYGTTTHDPILRQDSAIAFDVYQLGQQPEPLLDVLKAASVTSVFAETTSGQTQMAFPIKFGNYLMLRGLTVPRRTVHSENDGVNNQLYFEPVAAQSGATLNVFMHLMDQEGILVAQRDLLGVPPAQWQPGIVFVQDNFVPFTRKLKPGTYRLYLGLYDWQSGLRVPVVNQDDMPLADRLYLGEIKVVDR